VTHLNKWIEFSGKCNIDEYIELVKEQEEDHKRNEALYKKKQEEAKIAYEKCCIEEVEIRRLSGDTMPYEYYIELKRITNGIAIR
jgi:hypothetical protein